MNKQELLNFAKGIKPEPKNILFVFYHLSEINQIVIDGHKIKQISNGKEFEFQFIKEVQGDFMPKIEQLQKAFSDWLIEWL